MRRRGVVVLAAAALLFGGCTISREAAPETTRQLGVDSVRRIIDRPALSPAVWAPDGRRFAYGGVDGIYIGGVDGSARRIAPAEVVTALSWSRPLDLLAVVDRGRLATMRPDGSDRRAITVAGFVTAVAWAPGSDRLAIVVRRPVEGTSRFELWLMSRDGGFRRFVRAAPPGQAMRRPQWLANSLYLVYGLSVPSESVITEAWQVRIAYPDRRRLSLAGPAEEFVLAPSGRLIAYVTGPKISDGIGRVVIARLDAGERFTLTPEEGRYTGLTWSPQGDKLAFAVIGDEAHARVWIADSDGSGRLLVHDYALEFTDPGIALSIAWSPDGRRLLFGTNTGTFSGPIWLAEFGRR
jgi:dipeptidyl aminopeptidase/acylaminoacyl peptidase